MITKVNTSIVISSPSFKHDDFIPEKFSCNGQNINPAIKIHELPEETQSLVLIIEDPDAHYGTFDHWIMWNIPPTGKIEENSVPGVQGLNSKKEYGYTGPCPPKGNIHHYHFKIYALDTSFNFKQEIHKNDLLRNIEDHVIAYGEIIGLFKN